ncbi:hypothetical protein Tco_0759653 [Tanacetum coccineum]
MQFPPQNLQKDSSQPKGEHIKKDKGKKAISSKDAEEVSTESDSDDKTTHVPGSMVESSKKKDLKKFDFVTKDGEHVHLTEEQISAQKKIEEEAKAEAARREGEMRKKIDCSSWSRSSEQERMDNLRTTEAELGINLNRPLSEHDPFDRLNDLANKKRKHADDIHDFFRYNKRLKSSVQHEDHPTGTVLNEPVLEIFFRLHQGPGLDNHAGLLQFSSAC